MPTTNLHIYPSKFTNETRILKETHSLAKHGVFDRIEIIAMGGDNLPTREKLDECRHLWRVPLLTSRCGRSAPAKILRVLEWTLRILAGLLGSSVACVNCHSLSVLPLACLIKLIWRAQLVYDAHELETESAAASGFRKRLAKFVERTLIRRCNQVIVVSDSIADWYRTTYGLTNVYTVRNKPEVRENCGLRISDFGFVEDGASENPQSGPVRIQQPRNPKSTLNVTNPNPPPNPLRTTFHLPPSARIFLYQGILERGRGLDILLEVFQETAPHNHLICMGYGSWESTIRDRAAASSNIHFHPAVPPHELAEYTRCADVGLCLIEECCLSYRYCLPNKLFEYLAAGVPTIISDLPDMARVINTHECGWIVEPNTSAVLQVINEITPASLTEKAAAARRDHDAFTWEEEERALLSVYSHQSPSKAAPLPQQARCA